MIKGISFSFLFLSFIGRSQTVNYINNGGFEEAITLSTSPYFVYPKNWGAVDSLDYFGELLSGIIPPIKVPYCTYTYQWPRHGNNHLISTLYWRSSFDGTRGYPRNRLKNSLKTGVSYCFTMYANLSNNSTFAISSIGAYFGGPSLDTISLSDKTITYLNPQVLNPLNNIIIDTLNWVTIKGSFIANGTEKYVILGNFRSDTNTSKLPANPTYLPEIFSEYLIDDVSLVETDLPAFAGRDTVVFPGDSVFLGRIPDVGIDEACVWYKLPSLTPIDTIAGFWVKPLSTCTYVVRQEICGNVKWDTVNIYMNGVGIPKLTKLRDFQIFPNPAHNIISVKSNEFKNNEMVQVKFTDVQGRLVFEEYYLPSKTEIVIDISGLINGLYLLYVKDSSGKSDIRKFSKICD